MQREKAIDICRKIQKKRKRDWKERDREECDVYVRQWTGTFPESNVINPFFQQDSHRKHFDHFKDANTKDVYFELVPMLLNFYGVTMYALGEIS